jgi:hydroxyacylglutathione hydrolase
VECDGAGGVGGLIASGAAVVRLRRSCGVTAAGAARVRRDRGGYAAVMTAPEIVRLDDATVQIRQPKSSHWEAPFVFLLFGTERALLLDTGATNDEAVFPLRGTVDRLIDEWLAAHPAPTYELVVAHTHAHGDHVAGDPLFADRASTRVVGTAPEDVASFFGFTSWPDEVVPFDLGRRVVDVIGGPGHEPSAVLFADAASGTVFTGDTICPGHLYVRDEGPFRATIERLVRYRDAHPDQVRRLLGAHVEMSAEPGVVYPPGTVEQPDEAPLELSSAILSEVLTALDDPSARVVRDRFVVARD